MSTFVDRDAGNPVAVDISHGQGKPRVRLNDHMLLVVLVTLGLFGIAMIGSASMDYAAKHYSTPFYFIFRQLVFLALGVFVGYISFKVPLSTWEKLGPVLMLFSIGLLILVLFVGKEVNGSKRWIDLGFITVQVSEAVKFFVIVYLAGYLVRQGHQVQTTLGGFIRPLLLISGAAALLIFEPDFGAAVVILATSIIMIWVAGVLVFQFLAIVAFFVILGALLIVVSPYRMDRVLNFTNPFADPFDAGFQLVQSLIAIGSGGFSGVGFGHSVQKVFYLPEAHTDFLFAILCEELGLIGAVFLILLYSFIVWRCFRLAHIAEVQGNRFAAYVVVGIGSWVGIQSFINMGVSLGVLPTKGITLPLMSYGGSSVVVFAIAFALLLRVEYELKKDPQLVLRSRESMLEEQSE